MPLDSSPASLLRYYHYLSHSHSFSPLNHSFTMATLDILFEQFFNWSDLSRPDGVDKLSQACANFTEVYGTELVDEVWNQMISGKPPPPDPTVSVFKLPTNWVDPGPLPSIPPSSLTPEVSTAGKPETPVVNPRLSALRPPQYQKRGTRAGNGKCYREKPLKPRKRAIEETYSYDSMFSVPTPPTPTHRRVSDSQGQF